MSRVQASTRCLLRCANGNIWSGYGVASERRRHPRDGPRAYGESATDRSLANISVTRKHLWSGIIRRAFQPHMVVVASTPPFYHIRLKSTWTSSPPKRLCGKVRLHLKVLL